MINNIQVLRAFSAVVIMLHHAYMGKSGLLLSEISKYIFFAVDIFFIISGFVITHTLLNTPSGFRNSFKFIEKRMFRVYFGYWPFFFLTLGAIYLFQPGKIKFLFLGRSFFLSCINIWRLVIPVSWTLAFEVYFYLLIFFLILLVPLRHLGKAFIILSLAVFIEGKFLLTDNHTVRYVILSPFLLEFFAGGLARYYLWKSRSRWTVLLCIAGTLGCYYWGFSTHIEPFDVFNRVCAFGLGSFFLFMGAITLENMNINKVPKIVLDLGDASYSIYLSHMLFIFLYGWAKTDARLFAVGNAGREAGLLSLALLILVFSLYYYQYVERWLYLKMLSLKAIRISTYIKDPAVTGKEVAAS